MTSLRHEQLAYVPEDAALISKMIQNILHAKLRYALKIKQTLVLTSLTVIEDIELIIKLSTTQEN